MRILIVAPHPDDETLGCGGTIYKHKFKRDEIYWTIVTGISEKDGWTKEEINKRQTMIQSVSKEYGFKDVFQLDFPTTKIDTIPISSIIDAFVDIYKKVEPEIIYMPYAYDVHTDHQVIAKSFQSTIKWFRYPSIQKVLKTQKDLV